MPHLKRSAPTVRVAIAAALVAAALAGCGSNADEVEVLTVDTTVTPEPTDPETGSRAAVTFIADCKGEPIHRPRTITLACADANYQLTGLRWRNWGSHRAVAAGTGVANTCSPSCSQGSFARFPVTVVADGIVEGEASARYTRLSVSASGSHPKVIPRQQRFGLSPTGPELP